MSVNWSIAVRSTKHSSVLSVLQRPCRHQAIKRWPNLFQISRGSTLTWAACSTVPASRKSCKLIRAPRPLPRLLQTQQPLVHQVLEAMRQLLQCQLMKSQLLKNSCCRVESGETSFVDMIFGTKDNYNTFNYRLSKCEVLTRDEYQKIKQNGSEDEIIEFTKNNHEFKTARPCRLLCKEEED